MLIAQQKSKLKSAEMRFMRPLAGYRMVDYKRYYDIRQEFVIEDIKCHRGYLIKQQHRGSDGFH